MQRPNRAITASRLRQPGRRPRATAARIAGLLVLYVAAGGSWVAAQEGVRIATQPEGHGLSARSIPYVECAMETMGMPYMILQGPWERAQRGTQTGEYDGFFIATRNETRDRFAVRSIPFVTITWNYVTLSTSTIAPDDPDFLAQRFAADRGTARIDWLQGELEAGRITGSVTTVDTAEQVLKMLLTNRVDVGLLNDHLLERALDALGLEEDAVRSHLTRHSEAGIYFSHRYLGDHPQFLERFNRSMEACMTRLDG